MVFANAGNTCYLNAAMHVLLHAPQLTNYFLMNMVDKSSSAFVRAYADLVRAYWSGGAVPVAGPYDRATTTFLKKHADLFPAGEQHDALEAMTRVLEDLHEGLGSFKGRSKAADGSFGAADGSFGAADGSFGADALKNLVPGMPPEIGDAVSQMMQGVDMQDIMALAQDIDEKDVQDIVGALDPVAMTSLMSDFSLDKLMDVAKNIDPASLTKIADKFDKDRLAKVASKVDQEALLKMLNPSSSSKRGSKRR